MGLTELLFRRKFKIENYKKYVTDVTSCYGFMMNYLSLNNGDTSKAPKFLVDVYIVVAFLADVINGSTAQFFFNDNHIYKDKVKQALLDCELNDVADIYELMYINLGSLNIDYNGYYNDFIASLSDNIKNNLEIYEQELYSLNINGRLYNKLDEFLKKHL